VSDGFRWPAVTKDPDETLPVSLGVFALCAQFWRANEEYDIGDFAWPNLTVINGQIVKGAYGLVLECTGVGRSGSKEPKLNSAVADTALAALDGSVQWTPRVAALQGVDTVTQAEVLSVVISGTTDAGDLVAGQVVVDEGTKLLVDYSAGTIDTDYEVLFSFVIGGRTRTGRQLVQVRDK
jgi:hypothetical protein